MNRRRFLALTGTTVAGLWLGGTGLIQLSRRMVIAFSGRCSFCSKEAGTVFGLAGVVGRPDRVCNECIDICLEIIKEDRLLVMAENASWTPSPDLTSEGAPEPTDSYISELLRALERARGHAAETRELERLRGLLDGTAANQPKVQHDDLMACSFCDRNQREVEKLIAGPTVFICEACVGDAAALLKMYA